MLHLVGRLDLYLQEELVKNKMAKEILFKGKNEKEIKEMDLQDFIKLIPTRHRRSINRGLTEPQKKLMKKIESKNRGDYKKTIKTHCRDMIILPKMVGHKILVYNGKAFSAIDITLEMLGHYLGEFVDTRSRVKHSAPGIGATRSTAYQSVK